MKITEERLLIKEAMEKIAGLKGLHIPVERIPDDVELAASFVEFDALMDGLFDVEMNFDPDAAPAPGSPPKAPTAAPAPFPGRTKQIMIRVPSAVLHAIKGRARERGVKYQTLINRMLKSAVDGWTLPEAPRPSL